MKLPRDKYLIPDEFRRLLYAARVRPHKHQKRDLALLSVCGHLGLRRSELIAVRMGDLLFPLDLGPRPPGDPALVRVRTLKRKDARGQGVYREVGLHDSARLPLIHYVRTLEPGEREPWSRVFPLTAWEAGYLFKRYAKLAGLNPRYSIHALRHTRGLMLYAARKDAKLVQLELGHAQMASTEVYIHTVEGAEIAATVGIDMEEEPTDGRA